MSLPLIIMLLSIIFNGHDGDISNNLLKFVLFPIILLPIFALLYQIGSIHHKELLLTYPLNNFIYGWLRPVILSLIYSSAFTGALKLTNGYTTEELLAAFIASLFYMMLATLSLTFFKNIALGIALPLVYLFFGMFTTGSGQGAFYLMQWGRVNPDISLYDCIITQGIASIVLSFLALYFLKHRNKYQYEQ